MRDDAASTLLERIQCHRRHLDASCFLTAITVCYVLKSHSISLATIMMRGGRDRAQRNLYVLNLPLDATTDQFEALFRQFGLVEHAVILATLDHLARRRGFILMSNAAQAKAAIDNLNGHVWHHYRIEVSFAIVQRSGTPFSQEAAYSLGGGDRPAQMSPSDPLSQVSSN